MPTDTNVDKLVINVLTQQQYDGIQNPSANELFLTPYVIDSVPTQASGNPVSSGGMHNALANKIDKSSTAGLVKNDGTIDTNTYLTSHDFTHVANTTVTTSETITFAANQRGSQMITVSDDISILFVVNNDSDNYLWIENSDTTNNIDVTISSVTHNGNVVSNVRMPRDGIAVPAGGTCEIGIVCNTDGAFITSRDDLE